jgi:hypothetical protein
MHFPRFSAENSAKLHILGGKARREDAEKCRERDLSSHRRSDAQRRDAHFIVHRRSCDTNRRLECRPGWQMRYLICLPVCRETVRAAVSLPPWAPLARRPQRRGDRVAALLGGGRLRGWGERAVAGHVGGCGVHVASSCTIWQLCWSARRLRAACRRPVRSRHRRAGGARSAKQSSSAPRAQRPTPISCTRSGSRRRRCRRLLQRRRLLPSSMRSSQRRFDPLTASSFLASSSRHRALRPR